MKLLQPYIKDKNIYISTSSIENNPYTWNDLPYDLDLIDSFYNEIEKLNNGNSLNIVDIGAQSGAFCLMSQFFPNTTWYCFEPDPLNFSLLSENIILNNIINVKLFQEALSDKIGESEFNICKKHRGLNTLGEKLKRFTEEESFKINVNLNTLDNIFEQNKVDLIKIDTEGAEYSILQGAKSLLKNSRPKILLEYSNDNLSQFNLSIHDLNNLFVELNYKISWIKGENVFIEPL
jgi:FkbM family methyltransferase